MAHVFLLFSINNKHAKGNFNNSKIKIKLSVFFQALAYLNLNNLIQSIAPLELQKLFPNSRVN